MTEAMEQEGKPAGGVFGARLGSMARFLAAGTVNTLLSIAVYQGALFVTGHVAAYIIAYVAGIVFAYIVYARHVFNAALSAKQFVVFALFYVASGGVGALVNAALIEHLVLHPRMAIFITVLIMLPLNYAGSKWCLRGRAAQAP